MHPEDISQVRLGRQALVHAGVGAGTQVGRDPAGGIAVSVPDADHLVLLNERIAVQRQVPVTGTQNDDLLHG
jgi:hypothetical protein